MTPATLITIGEALHGADWQTALAAQIQCNPRTLYRYVNKLSPIPAEMRHKLQILLYDKQKQLMELARKL